MQENEEPKADALAAKFGVRNYGGPAVERRRRIKISNFSDLADEDAVRAEYDAMADQLSADDDSFFNELEVMAERSTSDVK